MATVHFIQQGKGGVGKSVIASFLYQVLRHRGKDVVEEFMDFMKGSESDSMKVLLNEFGDDLSDEEVRMLRIKFISDVAN